MVLLYSTRNAKHLCKKIHDFGIATVSRICVLYGNGKGQGQFSAKYH